MTVRPNASHWITQEEYLNGEILTEVRHEYVDGQVFAMAGGSQNHNRITANILAFLHQALRGKQCEPFSTDMKLKIPPSFADVFYYPDIMVACDPTDDAEYYRERPCILFEVISPSTERIDRGEKVLSYRHISALEVYALVEQDEIRVTVLRRTEQGWSAEVISGRDASLKLPMIDVELTLEKIYERTTALSLKNRPG